MWSHIILLLALLSPCTQSAALEDVQRPFQYTVESSTRYATPLPSSLPQTTTYAPAFTSASTLLPPNVNYTTYTLVSNAARISDGPYGQSAYASLWASLSYSQTIPFTTTASATPVPSSSLIFPPPLYHPPRSTSNGTKLPTDFIWGVAGSAWQIEGGLQFGGRGPSVLDTIGALSPNGTAATPGTNDSVIANMHYFLYKQDIARLAALGVPYYSFSISWSRIVPFGLAESPVNTEALAHYDDVIETCMQYGITPLVTLMHADQPLLVMTRYGNRVPYSVTFNEPNILPTLGAASWEGVKEIVRAHGCSISMKFANNLAIPLNLTDTSHVEAAYRYQDYILGIMGSPLGVITPFDNEELSQLAGKIDYYSLDAYTPQLVAPPVGGIDACVNNTQHPLWPICVDVSTYKQADDWLIGQPSNDYSHIASQYVRQQVGYVWQTYRPRGIMVSEFGYNAIGEADLPLDTQRYDLLRSTYYQQYLDELLKAKQEDGANVIGALAWSFADNNEFGSYKQQYGLQSVNRTDGTLTRSYKRSFFDLVDWFHAYVESH